MSGRATGHWSAGLLAALLVTSCSLVSPTLTDHGVPNLAVVEPGVWRSGEPTAEGWRYLQSLGVKHVVKLNFESEGRDDTALQLGMDVHLLPLQPEGDLDLFDDVTATFVQPDPAALAEIERVIVAGDGVLIHCTHGQDRTGLAVGRYRVFHDHWTKDAAYAEMLAHHFHPELHGLHESWEKLRP